MPRKTKDYQAVVFTYHKNGGIKSRDAQDVQATDLIAARAKMTKSHGEPVVDGVLVWTVGAKPGE